MYDTQRMIAHLRGTLLEKQPGQVVVETAGVGYDVTIPVSTFTQLPDAGGEVRLRIHTHVREDALSLYGFSTADEKGLFEKLISISGIGPKLAITVLSGLAVADLRAALAAGDLARLTRIPGVGKKTAERMIVELRDKMGSTAPAPASTALDATDRDVLSALLNLGAARPAAEAAIAKAKRDGGDVEFESLFRRALEGLR
jgi:Holliday junction DNA helicase RuvA